MEEENKVKLEAIQTILNTDGGFFLVSYDKDGFSNVLPCMGENAAAYVASKLYDLICNAQKDYINFRSKELDNEAD